MKKLIALLVVLCLACSLASAEETSLFVQTDSHILVACFSATGHTLPLAETVAAHLQADLFIIEAAEPYTTADLNYSNNSSRANQEMNDDTSRPALASPVPNMAQYDTVIIAHPIWWGQAPRIIETFIESHDLSGKTLVTFCTSGSSGYGRTKDILAALTDDSVTWLDGRRFSASVSSEELLQWVDSLGLQGGKE